MQLPTPLINLVALTFGLGTAGSLLIHDTNLDKATLVALNTNQGGENIAEVRPGSSPHTHSERASLHQAVRDLNASHPRVQPRNQNDKKYIQSKPTRGHHPFDNYTLPVIG